MVLKDGSLTRLDHKICVPILWTLEAVLNLILNIQYRRQIRSQSFSASLGRLLLLVHLPLLVSYALLMGNVVANAPTIRRAFGNLQQGRLYFNLGLGIISFAMCASLFPSAFRLGDALQETSHAYADLIQVLDRASATGDVAALANLSGPLAELETSGVKNHGATRQGSIISVTYIFIFLAAGIIPGWLLARYVNTKISLLERNRTSLGDNRSAADLQLHIANPNLNNNRAAVDIRLDDLSARQEAMRKKLGFQPELPQDRPFAHLVTASTPTLPPQLNEIMVDKDLTSSNRAMQLRRALRLELQFLSAYALLLCAHGGMILFMNLRPNDFLSTRQNLEMVLAFPSWNFIIPGLIVSSVFLYDALTKKDAEADSTASTRTQPSFPAATLPATGIQCSQVVDIALTTEHSEKRLEDLDEEEFGYGRNLK